MTRRIPLTDHDMFNADVVVELFRDSECYAFAEALRRLTGFELVALANAQHPLRHAAVRDEDGRLYDARGLVSEADFGEPFGVSPPYQLKVVTIVDLRHVRPVHESMIDRATRVIEARWPEWVRIPTEHTVRLETFLGCFEKLCAEHGFYVHGAFPGTPVQISSLEGDGVRYPYKTNLLGSGHALEAVIEPKKRDP